MFLLSYPLHLFLRRSLGLQWREMAERSNAAVLSRAEGFPLGKTVDPKGPGVLPEASIRRILLIYFLSMPFFAYILKSLKDQKYYYGHCANLDTRVSNHNSGKTRSTKSRRPFVIHYYESFETKSEAAKREYFFKSIAGYNYLKSNRII